MINIETIKHVFRGIKIGFCSWIVFYFGTHKEGYKKRKEGYNMLQWHATHATWQTEAV